MTSEVVHSSLLVIALLHSGLNASNLKLSPATVLVVENTSVTLTCSSSSETLTETRWTNSQYQGVSNLYKLGQTCTTSNFLNTTSYFNGICNSDSSFSVKIERVDRYQHGAKWQCIGRIYESNNVLINVKVPVSHVAVIGPSEMYMIENKIEVIKCAPSACRPYPTVRWYIRIPGTNDSYNIVANTTESNTTNNHGLVLLNNYLHLLPNRSVNGWLLYCKAWTDTAKFAISSKEIVVNVSFPPDKAPLIYGYENDTEYRFIEFDRGEFSCSVTGGNPLAILSWNCFNSTSTTTIIINKTVKSNLTWTAIRNYKVCSCLTRQKYGYRKNTSIVVDVLYPPSKPLFTISSIYVSQVVHVIENNTLQVACESGSNPTPNYTWSGPQFSNKMEQTLNIPKVNLIHEGQYECTASNRMFRSNRTYKDGINISSITVKVLYPPSQLGFRYGKPDGHLIRLNAIFAIKGDTFIIYCDAVGNPPPAFKWNNLVEGPSINVTTITSDANRTCTASNEMNETVGIRHIGNTSATIHITVFYPPDVPKISASTETSGKITVTQIINITETETIEVECYSKSRPTPSYTWFVNETQVLQRNVYKLVNISRKDAGKYTCRVYNLMNRTFGITEEGNISSSIISNILYPNEVGPLSEISVTKASMLSIACPVKPGNPSTSEIFWTRRGDTKRWNSSQLIIFNVSREDDTFYTCTVSSKMIPTVGSITEVNKSSEFHLNVFFSSVVKSFSEYGNEFKQTIVVNETEDVSLACTAEANPASIMAITSPDSKQIVVVHNFNTLRYNLQNASYVNAGDYICTSRNNYTNSHPSSSRLILIVRSPPKYSSDNTDDGKIATILNADITLQFTARDYLDEPNKTTFMWYMYKKGNVSIKEDANKFHICSTELESNLTIKNITQEDFGNYRVHVSNTVGEYIHLYELVARGMSSE